MQIVDRVWAEGRPAFGFSCEWIQPDTFVIRRWFEVLIKMSGMEQYNLVTFVCPMRRFISY